MDEQHIRSLLKRYTEGHCTEAEKILVEQWYENEAKKTAATDDESVFFDLERAQQKSWRKITQNTTRKQKRLPWLGAAAAAVLLICGIVVFMQRDGIHHNVALTFTVLEAAKGEVKELILPDSTRVWINSGSRLRYNNLYNQSSRDLILDEGEVYFDVVHNPAKPFRVVSGNTVTRVLGTAFNIRAYAYLAETQISVSRGRVGVQTEMGNVSGSEELLPDEQLVIDTGSGVARKLKVKSRDFISWREGVLQFNNESLATITKMIENKFDIKSRFESDSLGEQRFTAGFKTNESLEMILDDISAAGNFFYTINNKEIFFSFKNSKQ